MRALCQYGTTQHDMNRATHIWLQTPTSIFTDASLQGHASMEYGAKQECSNTTHRKAVVITLTVQQERAIPTSCLAL